MAVALAQDGSFGFAIQTEKGSFVTPDTWLPVTGTQESIQLQNNYITLDMADTVGYENKYLSIGRWAEGRITVPLVPGVMANLLSWIQDRDSYNQGKWASVLVDCVNEVKKLRDVKVRSASFEFVKAKPVTCTLEVAALHIEAGTGANPVMPRTAPYIYQEADVEIATGGGSLAEDVNCEMIQIHVDNMVEDCADGMRLAASAEPLQLYNTAGCRVRGGISRDFVDNALYADFADGEEAALSIELARGANSMSLSLPRLLYVTDSLGLPGSHSRRLRERVQFVALGSTDGATAPITLA